MSRRIILGFIIFLSFIARRSRKAELRRDGRLPHYIYMGARPPTIIRYFFRDAMMGERPIDITLGEAMMMTH